MFKKVFIIFCLIFCFGSDALAIGLNDNTSGALMGAQEAAFSGSSGLESSLEIGAIVQVVIETILSLLGIIFVGLLVYAGYLWMTAAGNEDKVQKSMDIIKRAIIGLIIVVSAYAITAFVFKSLEGVESNGGGGYDGPVGEVE